MRANTLTLLAAFAAAANAHTLFTTLFVNGVNQGDGTCVRQPKDDSTCTSPVSDPASEDMVCGFNGQDPVNFTCPVPASSTLSFEFRLLPGSNKAGSIAESHKGPCAVYLKQVSSTQATSAAGGGWFKIWDEGHDDVEDKWCTERLIENNGLLSVKLPSGLPGGAYLVRPELLALHNAYYNSDPQYYIGCAQIFVEATDGDYSKKLEIPSKYEAQIPGYAKIDDKPLHFDIYNPVYPYPLAGPPAYYPEASSSSSSKRSSDVDAAPAKRSVAVTNSLRAAAKQFDATFVPDGCLVKNANWCGVEVPTYNSAKECWAATKDCYDQEKACWAAAPPSGGDNCKVWDAKCAKLNDICNDGSTKGPAPQSYSVSDFNPGPIPAPVTIKTTQTASYGSGPVTYSAPAASSEASSASYSAPASSASSPATYPGRVVSSQSPSGGVAYSSGTVGKPSSSSAATSPVASSSSPAKYSTPAASSPAKYSTPAASSPASSPAASSSYSAPAVSSESPAPVSSSVPLSTGTAPSYATPPRPSVVPPYANGTWTPHSYTPSQTTTLTLSYKKPSSSAGSSPVDSVSSTEGVTTHVTMTTKATTTVYTTVPSITSSLTASHNGTYSTPAHYRRHLAHHANHQK